MNGSTPYLARLGVAAAWAASLLAGTATAAAAPRQPAPPTTAPATQPADDDGSASAIADINKLQGTRPATLAEAVSLRRTPDHRLQVVTSVADTEGEVHIPLKDDPGVAKIMVANRGESAIHFMRYRTDVPGYTTTYLEVMGPGPVTIVRDTFSRATGHQHVELFQRMTGLDNDEPEKAVRLTVTDNDAKSVEITAADVDQLIRRHPSEAARYLRPMLRDFGMESVLFAGDAKEAWQVLARDLPPDAEMKKKIDAILPKLDSDDATAREQGQKALSELGQPAANALQAFDRNSLTPQQNAEVDLFLAPYSRVSAEEAANFRASPDRLASYLSLEDVALRKLAYARLKAVAKDVPTFDPEGAADIRLKQVGEIEAFISGPTTRP